LREAIHWVKDIRAMSIDPDHTLAIVNKRFDENEHWAGDAQTSDFD
jgi:hypothetical protein